MFFPGGLSNSVNNKNSFSLISYNINSIPANLESFIDQSLSFIEGEFDAIGFCETKLTSDLDRLYTIPNYRSFFNHLSRHKGGVALYVRDNLDAVLRPDLTIQFDFIETIFIEIRTKTRNTIIGQIYRRPKSDIKSFFNKIKDILAVINQENKHCILSGDFNLDLLKNNVNNEVKDLIAIFNSNFFFNSITKPTRVSNTSATIIDHIWTNNFKSIQHSGIIYDTISDHFPVFTVFNLNPVKDPVKKTIIQYRDFSERNIAAFKNHLQDICWDLVFATRDPDIAMENFNTIFNASFYKFFPLISKQVKTKSLDKPYITQEIEQLIGEKIR